MGVCVFRCNLPSVLLAEWSGSFACHCGKTGVKWTPNESRHRKLTQRRKFSCCSCWDLNSRPFDQKSGTLTNKLSQLHVVVPLMIDHHNPPPKKKKGGGIWKEGLRLRSGVNCMEIRLTDCCWLMPTYRKGHVRVNRNIRKGISLSTVWKHSCSNPHYLRTKRRIFSYVCSKNDLLP